VLTDSVTVAATIASSMTLATCCVACARVRPTDLEKWPSSSCLSLFTDLPERGSAASSGLLQWFSPVNALYTGHPFHLWAQLLNAVTTVGDTSACASAVLHELHDGEVRLKGGRLRTCCAAWCAASSTVAMCALRPGSTGGTMGTAAAAWVACWTVSWLTTAAAARRIAPGSGGLSAPQSCRSQVWVVEYGAAEPRSNLTQPCT